MLDPLIHGLWVASLWLQGLVSAALLVRRVWKTFPFFTTYSLVTFLSNVALYTLRGHDVAYFWSYWLCEVGGLILGFGVVYEIFRTLLQGHSALGKLAKRVFLGVLFSLILVAMGVAYSQPSGEIARVMRVILLSEETMRLLEVGFIGFLFFFSKAFGLHWRQSVFGIAVGLGVFVSVELMALAIRLQFGSLANPAFNLVRVVSFNSSLVIWIGYVLAPERASARADLPKAAQLEQWNQAIMELIHQ